MAVTVGPFVSGNEAHLEWEHDRDGRVPHNAVGVGMKEGGREIYYIARHSHRGDTLPGKVHDGHRCLYVCHGGKSHKKSEYEVLCVHR